MLLGQTGGAIQTLPGASLFDAVLAPLLATDQNDYTFGGMESATQVALNANAAVNITGVKGAQQGRILVFSVLPGSSAITFKNASGASAAGNRLNLGADTVISAGGTLALVCNTPSEGWRLLFGSAGGSAGIGGALVGFQSFTGSGTYTPTAGATKAIVICIGGGGGGGGALGDASTSGGGGGGGGGSYVSKFINGLAASYAYSVGTGGPGGDGTPNPGTAGNPTTFGAGPLLSAGGGSGGQAGNGVGSTTLTTNVPQNGGAATGGDINATGANGGYGIYGPATIIGTGSSKGGVGGNGPFGGGGRSLTTNGGNGSGPGAGGGGGHANNATGRSGGNGSDGALYIWEYS